MLKPSQGYILVIPHVFPGPLGTTLKEPEGQDQFSKVLAVGDDVIDVNGNLRTTDAQIGDIILHSQTNKEFELKNTQYRMVHFSEVHGIYEGDTRN